MDHVKQAQELLAADRYAELEDLLQQFPKKLQQVAQEIRLQKALKINDSEELEELLDQYLAEYTKPPIANLLVAARVKMAAGKYREAIDLATRVIARDASNFEAAETIYICNINTKQFRHALEVSIRLREEARRLAVPVQQRMSYFYHEFLARTMLAQYEEALEIWEETADDRQRFPELITSSVFSSLLRCLVATGRNGEAIQLIKDNNLDESEDPQLALTIPLVWQAIDDEERCYAAFERLITLVPDSVEPKWNLALAKLGFGRLKEGLANYEVRWDWDEFPSSKRTFKSARWSAEDLSGKSILIWGEQGVGDQLLFLSLLPFVIDKNPAKIIVEVSEKLVPLVKKWYPEASVRDDRVKHTEGQLIYDQIDFNIPSGSLMPLVIEHNRELRTRRRYLRVPSDARSKLLPQNFSKKKWIVGLSWRSHYLTEARTFNYLSVHAVIRILELFPQDVGFVCLQYSISDDERQLLRKFDNIFVPDEDFFERVELNALYAGCCDLVVTAGTAVLQLAGIYKVPVITWLPKNDWVLLGQKHYPWFDNVIVVQGEAKWDTTAMLYAVIRKMKIALRLDLEI